MLGCCCWCRENVPDRHSWTTESSPGFPQARLANLGQWLPALLPCSRQHLLLYLHRAPRSCYPPRMLPVAGAPSILSAMMRHCGLPCGADHITDWAAATAASLVMPNSL